jgi:hypothetical protein
MIFFREKGRGISQYFNDLLGGNIANAFDKRDTYSVNQVLV